MCGPITRVPRGLLICCRKRGRGALFCASPLTRSERLKEREQAVVGMKPVERRVQRLDLGDRFLLMARFACTYTLVVSMRSRRPTHTQQILIVLRRERGNGRTWVMMRACALLLLPTCVPKRKAWRDYVKCARAEARDVDGVSTTSRSTSHSP